ncbi:MAG: autotransporter domain-containing protein [Elusimicrobia bacterium]|nr:autotransporter domain-containing protein [Elusimicrobiota bacterium]
MKKLNELAVKVLSLVVAVMLVSSQNVFASGRYANITEDTTVESGVEPFENYNEDSGNGGVFLVASPVTLTIGNNVSFKNNVAEQFGGAIELDNFNAKVKIGSDVIFKNNKANDGGAICNDSGELTIDKNATFQGNVAAKNSSGDRGGGGAIYNCSKTVIKDGAKFIDNTADSSAGAIYNTWTILTIGNDAQFSGNKSNDIAGAIYNDYGTVNIGVAKFLGNTASSTGGAIYNDDEGTINLDNGTIFESNSASSKGSAIYNEKAGKVNIGNNVYFYKNGTDSGAGAIYNTGNDSVITIGAGAIFEENSSHTVGGGAIYNDNSGKIEIGDSAQFKNNTASSPGGAIDNGNGGNITIGSKTLFEGNKGSGAGGAINNGGTITIGDGSIFRNNICSTTGAIYNSGSNSVITIGSNVLFEGNQSTSGPSGAIYNGGGEIIIGSNALFKDNQSNSVGGAIQNSGGKLTIGKNSVFKNNKAINPGGAIYNSGGQLIIGSNALFQDNECNTTGGAISEGNITIEDGAKFIGNKAKYAPGGAIYGQGKINLIANTKNVEFTGNKHYIGTSNEAFNAIYSYGSGQVNMWASNKANIVFNDPIEGNSTININKPVENYQENIGTGKVVLNADMRKYTGTVNFYSGTIEIGENGTLFDVTNSINNIDVNNATIKMANGKIEVVKFGKESSGVSISNKLNLIVDADLKNKAMDMVVISPLVNIGEGKLNVKKINVTEDSEGSIRVDFAGVAKDKLLTTDKARSVLYSYDAKLEYGKIEYDSYGGHYSDVDGYYYTFTKNGFNPVTAAGAVSASVGGYATQSVVTGQAFASMDRQVAAKNQPKTVAPKTSTKETAKPAETKAATKGKTEQKSSVKDSKTTTNNPKDKKDDSKKKKKAQSIGLLYASTGDQVFEETSKIERGAWLRPFILNETVKVGDTNVDNNLYGTLAGIDLPVKGDILASFYLGYAGSKQKVEEVKSNQIGYVLGATGMLIKEKWYAGLTANIIFNKASVDTDDGTNDIDMNMYSIGAKAGYNYDMGKNWILEPNITLMYGIVNCGSYETTLTKVDSQSVNNILLEPQVKARWQLTNGWQPYGLLGYAANLSSKPTVKTDAGDLDLDSIGGYVEFGAGVNKDFVNTAWSCYAQLTGRAAGRSGFEGNFGVKYKF